LEFIERTGLNYLHVFPYSKRPNTAAEKMPGHLAPDVVKERAKILRELSTRLKHNYIRRFLGQETEVLWENDVDRQARRMGKSKNYLEVGAPSHASAEAGVVQRVQLKGFVE